MKRVGKALGVLGALVAAGTIGYHVLENMTILDALYMTVVTISTVGFGEIHPLSPIGRCIYHWPDSLWGQCNGMGCGKYGRGSVGGSGPAYMVEASYGTRD